jgi:hypothetical protein
MKNPEIICFLKDIIAKFKKNKNHALTEWDKIVYELADFLHLVVGNKDVYEKLSIIWFSSRMASQSLVILSLELLLETLED